MATCNDPNCEYKKIYERVERELLEPGHVTRAELEDALRAPLPPFQQMPIPVPPVVIPVPPAEQPPMPPILNYHLGWWPDEGEVGPRTPVLKDEVHGGVTIDKDDTVIQSTAFYGKVTIKARRVKLIDCSIFASGLYGVHVPSRDYSVHMDWCLVDGMGQTSVAVGMKNFTFQNGEIRGSGSDLVRADGDVLIHRSRLHSLHRTPGAHLDAIQLLKGENIEITNNWIDIAERTALDTVDYMNSCFIISAGSNGGPVTNVLLQYNYFNGGNYSLYLGAGGAFPVEQVKVRDNRYGRDQRFGVVNQVADPAGFDRTTNLFLNGLQPVRP